MSIDLCTWEKRAGLLLGGMDIFVNVVGGLRIVEPAVDLGIIATIASSLKYIPVDPRTFVFGEVGEAAAEGLVSPNDRRRKVACRLCAARTKSYLVADGLSRIDCIRNERSLSRDS